jgi:hypothetical protein
MNDPHAAPPSGKVLDAMLRARQDMIACITLLDAAIYNPHDRALTEHRLDRVISEAISTLRHLNNVRHGTNSGVP